MNDSTLPPTDSSFDPLAETQPSPSLDYDPLAAYQPIRIPKEARPRPKARRRKSGGCLGCLGVFGVFLALIVGAMVFFAFLPGKTRVLILGIDLNSDRAPAGSFLGRSDTIVILQADPLKPQVSMLSIPRDLWVNIPGVGENRINTAHFFAEANQEGTGAQAAIQTIEANFGIRIPYYVRLRFEGFSQIVDAMGGIDITLEEPVAGLDAGKHHLNGKEALAFARSRKGADDFFRMQQGQMVVMAAMKKMLNPLTWWRLPVIVPAFFSAVDTNLPVWQMPRIGLAVLRVGVDNLDHRTITREMVQPFVTEGGAQVLGPRWEVILPLVQEMFGIP